jgi:glucose/arabinose dehydrogenase
MQWDWHSTKRTGTIWATDNGRDWLGDDLPPDEIDDLGLGGGDFGWPYCYGNRVPDTSFGGTPARCRSTIPPRVELQAHSAPLGLVFYKGGMFPARISGRPFCSVPRFVESQRANRLQDCQSQNE